MDKFLSGKKKICFLGLVNFSYSKKCWQNGRLFSLSRLSKMKRLYLHDASAHLRSAVDTAAPPAGALPVFRRAESGAAASRVDSSDAARRGAAACAHVASERDAAPAERR